MRWLLVLFIAAFGDQTPDSSAVAYFPTEAECKAAGERLETVFERHTEEVVSYVCAARPAK